MTTDHTTRPLDLDTARAWMQLCGSCDAGLPMSCTCPQGDPRVVISDLVAEVERLAREKDHLLTLSAEVLVTLEEAGAELERLRALLGQTTAALNVALSLAIPRVERDEEDQKCIEGCREALRQAVDALDTAGTAPAAGGEAGR